jgi:hypothetical protein
LDQQQASPEAGGFARVVHGNNGCKNIPLGGVFNENYKCLCGKNVNKSRIELSAFVSHVLSATYDCVSGE